MSLKRIAFVIIDQPFLQTALLLRKWSTKQCKQWNHMAFCDWKLIVLLDVWRAQFNIPFYVRASQIHQHFDMFRWVQQIAQSLCVCVCFFVWIMLCDEYVNRREMHLCHIRQCSTVKMNITLSLIPKRLFEQYIYICTQKVMLLYKCRRLYVYTNIWMPYKLKYNVHKDW